MPDASENYTSPRDINPIISKDEVDVFRDALSFDLDDKTFLDYAKTLKREADDFWNQAGGDGYRLGKRRSENEKYLFGRQLADKKIKKYSSKALDNIIWESEKYLRAMAVSKLPDITVKPGSDSDEAKKLAEELSKVVTSDIQSRERKRVLGLAFKHLPVYFTGCIKAFWNPQKGQYGDYDFKVVHPANLTLDFRAASNDPRDMDFIFETCEYTVKELTMMFPDKAKDLYEELRKYSLFGNSDDPNSKNENNERGLNSKVKIEEVWFKWYDKAKSDTGEKNSFQQVIGVAWYFNSVLLKKIKHPYWDWTGTPMSFTYSYQPIEGQDNTYSRNQQPVTEEMLRGMLLGEANPDVQTKEVFHNHLDYPEFPYIFMGMDQWGKTPLDETSRIEQAIPVQEEYDIHNRQKTEMIARSRGKHIYSADQGLTKTDISNNDPSDPDQDMLIRGDVNKTHTFIPGEQPSPALIQSIMDERERLFDKMSVHQATRGAADTDTAATNNQISREGDFTVMDDLVDDTINYAAEKMANWEMQFIKLFYTENHLRRILGPDGKWIKVVLHRDMIDDGMEVIISASGSDKLKAEQRAMDMAKMKLIDPFRFYKDIGADDPKGRTIDLMTFLMQPDMYLMNIKSGQSNAVQAASNIIEGQVSNQGQSPQAMQDIMQIQQGQIPPVPTQIDPNYLATFTQFMQSQEVEQLIQQYGDQFKQALLQFAQAVQNLGQQQPQQNTGAQPPQGAPGEMMGGTQNPVGPLAQNPTPDNTSRIAAIAGR